MGRVMRSLDGNLGVNEVFKFYFARLGFHVVEGPSYDPHLASKVWQVGPLFGNHLHVLEFESRTAFWRWWKKRVTIDVQNEYCDDQVFVRTVQGPAWTRRALALNEHRLISEDLVPFDLGAYVEKVKKTVSDKSGDTMTMAYDLVDPVRLPYKVEDWLRDKPCSIPHCVICQSPMTVRNEHNDRAVHFMHHAGSGCPSIASATIAYAYLRGLPRAPGASQHVSSFVKANLYGVFIRMRVLVPGLTWLELKECCARAKALGVWDLVGLPIDLAPYVLLTCKGIFPAYRFRSDAVFLFMEPNPSAGSFWMFPSNRKRIIYSVSGSKRALHPHDIDHTLAVDPLITDILALL
jgi:hypothetical protein